METSQGASMNKNQWFASAYYGLFHIYSDCHNDSLAAYYKKQLNEKYPDLAKRAGLKEYTAAEMLWNIEQRKEIDNYSPKEWGMKLYRMGENYFNTGDKKNAKRCFNYYIDECKKNILSEFCKEAEDFIEIIEKK